MRSVKDKLNVSAAPGDYITGATDFAEVGQNIANDANANNEGKVEQPVATTQEEPASDNALQMLYKSMTPDPTLDKQQIEKKRKAERAEKAIAALGDVGSAIANIWSATKGAVQPSNQSQSTLSGVYKDKWDKWLKDYKERMDKYNAGKYAAAQADLSNKMANRKQKLAEQREERLLEQQSYNNWLNNMKLEISRAKAQSAMETDEAKRAQMEAYTKKLEDMMNNPSKYWKPNAPRPAQGYTTTRTETTEDPITKKPVTKTTVTEKVPTGSTNNNTRKSTDAEVESHKKDPYSA